jgi:hypothetical protein
MPAARILAATLGSNGSATVRDVPTGSYRADLSALKDGCYLKEVRVAGQKAETEAVLIRGSTRLALVLSTAGATLSGTVQRPDDTPASDAAVILMSQGGAGRPPFVAVANEKGEFRLASVPPGRYQVLAAGAIRSMDYLDPFFSKEFDAIEVELEAAKTTTLTLRCTK